MFRLGPNSKVGKLRTHGLVIVRLQAITTKMKKTFSFLLFALATFQSVAAPSELAQDFGESVTINPNSEPGRLEVKPGDDSLLILPIRFRLTQNATMTVKGQAMEMWVKPSDVTGPVPSELNRIWKPARIQFVAERVHYEPLLKPENFEDLLKNIETAKRGDEEQKGSLRTKSISKLLDPTQRSPYVYNVSLLPFIGSTYQGYARIGGKDAVVGVWTDKPSRGEKLPMRTLLIEPEPMNVGSLARTIAHELGHNLGLVHPDLTEVSPFGRLMGGRNQGYSLTPEEIATARQTARQRIVDK